MPALGAGFHVFLLVGWAKALAPPFNERAPLVRRAHQLLSVARSMVGPAHESPCRRKSLCQRLCPPYGAAALRCRPHFFSGSSISLKRASCAHSSVTLK